VLFRSLVIGLTAFLSLVDLFATQAILPSLTKHYGVTPGAMGLASNASTFGMLVSGLAVGYFSGSIDRRLGILVSLVLLAIPTTLLAYAPNLAVFATLRVPRWLISGEVRKLVDRNDFQIKQLEPLHTALDHCLRLLEAGRVENRKEARFIPYLVQNVGQHAVPDQIPSGRV
jgi:Major Facilitator Superfamily